VYVWLVVKVWVWNPELPFLGKFNTLRFPGVTPQTPPRKPANELVHFFD